MKKLAVFVFAMIMLLSATGCASAESSHHVMASFYPMYIFAMNVFDGIDAIKLDCMTAPETGCLHDYQLLVGDMMKLSDADALIVCGAGMEAYLPDVSEQFPSLTVIDCSRGIDLIPEAHSDESDEEEEYNAHTWLDPKNAIIIVQTMADEASALFPEYAERINSNAAAYIERLWLLDAEIAEALKPYAGRKIVPFHEAFPYFARAYQLEIAAVISEEHENTLSPAQLSQVIEAVNNAGIPPLFIEPQYSSAAAYAVAAETGAKIYTLDPLVSGDETLDAYENGMRRNVETLLEAFAE